MCERSSKWMLAVFLMWIPALAAIIAGFISQTESNGTISCKMLLNSIGFRKVSFRWIVYSCVIPLLYIGIPYIALWIISPESLNLSSISVKQLIIMSLLGILVGILTALGEEIGWRGYLVPALAGCPFFVQLILGGILMDKVNVKLTVFFEEPFWVGLFEHIENSKLYVAKVTFGAEPKDYEAQEYIQKCYFSLKKNSDCLN